MAAEFTALENVMMPLLIRGVARAEAADSAAAQFEKAGLAGEPPALDHDGMQVRG